MNFFERGNEATTRIIQGILDLESINGIKRIPSVSYFHI